jgi:hypothetical protein
LHLPLLKNDPVVLFERVYQWRINTGRGERGMIFDIKRSIGENE